MRRKLGNNKETRILNSEKIGTIVFAVPEKPVILSVTAYIYEREII